MNHTRGGSGKYLVGAFLLSLMANCAAEGPSRQATLSFDQYATRVEARIGQEHGAPGSFLVGITPEQAARLRGGEVLVERLTPAGGGSLPGALLHDWRGTAFVPDGTVTAFEQALRNFAAYPHEFSPQVLRARELSGRDRQFQIQMTVQQEHVIAVTLDGTYDVRFGRLDGEHGWSTSRSIRIRELAADGRPLAAGEDHGFLWRLDTWWSYEQRDGGLYVQMETVSLTRTIPPGLGWIVGRFVQSVPRESLEFTLHAACAATSKQIPTSERRITGGR